MENVNPCGEGGMKVQILGVFVTGRPARMLEVFCFVLFCFFSLLVLVTKLLAKLQPEVLSRSYSGNLRSLYALKHRRDKSNVTWFLRRPISAKICQYSRNRDRVCL